MRIVWRKLISIATVIINRSGDELPVGVVMIARCARFAIHRREVSLHCGWGFFVLPVRLKPTVRALLLQSRCRYKPQKPALNVALTTL